MNRYHPFSCLLMVLATASCCFMIAAQETPAPPSDKEQTPPFKIIQKSPHGLPVVSLDVAGRSFLMEVAATDDSRRKGCGGRTRLLPNEGMIFVHPDEQVRNYWMKDCLIDLDVAFLDGKGRVVAIHRMKHESPRRVGERDYDYKSRLRRYSSRRPARYALEFKHGTIDQLKIRVGQTIPLPHDGLRSMVSGPG